MSHNSLNATTGAIERQAANGHQKLNLAAVFTLEFLCACSVPGEADIFAVGLTSTKIAHGTSLLLQHQVGKSPSTLHRQKAKRGLFFGGAPWHVRRQPAPRPQILDM
jgi:hypothetical protein